MGSKNVQPNGGRNKLPLSCYWCNPLPACPGVDTLGRARAVFNTEPKARGDKLPEQEVSQQLSLNSVAQYAEVDIDYDADVRR